MSHIRIHNRLETKDLRRQLRKNMTEAEKILWRALRNRKLDGIKFTRQHGFGAFVTDFYCSQHKLAIELDGGIHLQEDVALRDQARTEYIETWEIKVIRFRNEEVILNLESVLEKIKKHLQ